MIRFLDHKDKGEWKKLYYAYADFYKVPMNSGILDTLWEWIHDDNHTVNGICYELDCLLYTSPSPRDLSTSRMPSSA